ncbi:MAG TPA: hypothetical protein DCG57_07195 [Candidatus Riflebacteria bacterium]|jgi:hypothetical protein|nr:MAG: hypothetical protein CVV41_12360 [Candidatus Riflebacteria bacterium HGW-Riflebacteria-1]HAE38409.1 hypothetical protein [Candidatus Riflebacteria bacterium]
MTPFEIGILAGMIWAFALVVWTLAEITTGEPSTWLMLVVFIYEGFNFTPRGILTGAAWAFVDGFITGYVVSFIISWFF